MDTIEKPAEDAKTKKAAPRRKPEWEKPELQDVSEQVMAQPYIRFT